MKEEHVKYEGGLTFQAKKVKGNLRITDRRVLFVADKGQLAREEKPIINFPSDRLFTGETKGRLITSLLDKAGAQQVGSIFGDYLTLPFEDWFGVLQKPRFKTKNAAEWSDIVNNLMLSKNFDDTPINERRREIEKFKEFITYLSVQKFIRPLEFDPVSRVISVSGALIFVANNWQVEAPSEILSNAESWIKSFGMSPKWLKHQK